MAMDEGTVAFMSVVQTYKGGWNAGRIRTAICILHRISCPIACRSEVPFMMHKFHSSYSVALEHRCALLPECV